MYDKLLLTGVLFLVFYFGYLLGKGIERLKGMLAVSKAMHLFIDALEVSDVPAEQAKRVLEIIEKKLEIKKCH
jgi:hypothetical protein